jgi:hypothetical protein
MPMSPPRVRLPSSETSRALAPLGHHGRARVLRHGHEDLGDVELHARAGGTAALLDQGVDVGVADPDQAHHLAFAHALDDQLIADVVAELVVGNALLAQPLAQLGQAHLILGRDVGDGAVELGLVDARAGLARRGHHHALVDQRVEHLLAQDRRRRQLGAAARRVVADARQPLLQLARGDQLGVDDRDDVVGGLRHGRDRGQADGEGHGGAAPEEFQVSHRE